MNLAQVIRRALLQTSQVRQNGVSSALFTLAELVSAAQDCFNELTALLRASDADWNLTTRLSTDAAFTFEGETYTPTTSMALTATGRTYTLPPDFIHMKRIRCITESYRDVEFRHLDVDNPTFAALENDDTSVGPDLMYYDIIGRRTLRFASRPGTALDVEFLYEARYPFLYVYNGTAGNTAGVTVDSVAVTTAGGTPPTFLTERLSTPAQIMFNSTGGTGHPIVMSQTSTDDFVVTGKIFGTGQGRHIASFTAATTLDLEATWPLPTDTSIGWLICSAPEIMETHSQLFIKYLKYYIYDKEGSPKARDAGREYEMAKAQFKADFGKRSVDLEFAEDFEA